jgi:hypothetical protein
MKQETQPAGPRELSSHAVLICFAVPEEARFFRPPTGFPSRRVVTGIGARNAKTAIQDQLAREVPRMVLTCGFAGGLAPEHPLGQVLYDDSQAGPLQGRLADLGLQQGRFVHSDRVLVTPSEKARLREVTMADAVEMESSVIVTACRKQGVPVLVLRVISDTADESLPMDFNQYARVDGGVAMGRLLLGIAGHPAVIPRLIAFRRRLNRAAQALGGALQEVLPRLCGGDRW